MGEILYYTASSVIAALKKNNDVSYNELESIKCPMDNCNIKPEICAHGHQRKCHQRVKIIYKGKTVIIICFTYTILNKNHDGLINKNDSALRLLINRNILDESLLVSI